MEHLRHPMTQMAVGQRYKFLLDQSIFYLKQPQKIDFTNNFLKTDLIDQIKSPRKESKDWGEN